ncbi:translation machinery-associated protein 16 [Diaporthe eres]|uniref:Translation machinery-associated protein 16 n=1 Tax=Diaporthe eres TaxID=83184 RepID=A0ABR1NWW2_DIAER
MPKSLEKTRKRIAKKRNGNVVLHEFSRDTKKLHKAQVRDERLEKLAAARKRHDQPLSPITFFQKAAQENESKPFDLAKIQDLINQYVHQHDQEFEELKKSRRPGRPASVKEDLLSLKVETLRKEQQNGFCRLRYNHRLHLQNKH